MVTRLTRPPPRVDDSVTEVRNSDLSAQEQNLDSESSAATLPTGTLNTTCVNKEVLFKFESIQRSHGVLKTQIQRKAS